MSKSTVHLTAGWAGLIGIAVVWLGKLELLAEPPSIAGGVLFVLSAALLFATRNADEYVAALWRAGANAAFLALLAWYLGLPFLEGVMDGASGAERQLDFPTEFAPDFAFAAFFLAHAWARLRGTI